MKAASMFPPDPVLIVDDEEQSLRGFAMALRMQGISNVLECPDSREVARLLGQRPCSAMLLDLNMPFVSGEDILAMVSQEHPEIPVIVITAVDDLDTAVRCMKNGARDYMVKPVEKTRLVSGVKRVLEIRELQGHAQTLKESMLSGGALRNPEAFSGIITINKAMHSIFQYLESIASSLQPVLVTGETGVGKELIVRAVHALGEPRRPLVSVNVAGLDDHILADTLFGHVKGAYTGAGERRPGLVEKAAGGILHLDEIGDLNPTSQIKLLRLLQEGDYYPLGSDTARTADVRVVATTNRDLARLRESGRFRKDLYYRLSVHEVQVPPLRQRLDDLPLLLSQFIDAAAASLSRKRPSCPEDVQAFLAGFDFPGNIRELQSMVYDAVSRNKTGRLSPSAFRGWIGKQEPNFQGDPVQRPSAKAWSPAGREEGLPTLDQAAILLARETLARCGGNQSKAADLLGVSRQRLARILKKHAL